MRKYVINDGASCLVILTNDACFKQSKIPYLHAAAAVFRAIENRRFLIRAAQSGVSMIISPTGKILKYLNFLNLI
jgi:apolipoprotein N-acyltransferase